MTDPRQRIADLRRQLDRHNYNYYVLNAPEISDREFDMMMHELEDLEKQYPDKGVTIFTRYEHPVISAIAVIDINEGQEGDIEEINTKM